LHAEEHGHLIGVKVSRNAPTVCNMLFADDSLILMQADDENATWLNKVMYLYCQSSGQLVSDGKLSIFQPKYYCSEEIGGMYKTEYNDRSSYFQVSWGTSIGRC
jgi:hypothetical protein